MSEYQEQVSLFTFLRYHEARFPRLVTVHAIPNGLALTPRTAARAKAQGVRAGVWDIFVPGVSPLFARPDTPSGLYIEMKYGTNGLTEGQKAFRDALQTEYAFRVCKTWINAAEEIIRYIGIDDPAINELFAHEHRNRDVAATQGKLKLRAAPKPRPAAKGGNDNG